MTGLTFDVSTEIDGKRLEILREIMPKVSRLALLWNPTYPGARLYFDDMMRAAQSMGIVLQSVEVQRPEDFKIAFGSILTGRADALFVWEDPLVLTQLQQVTDFVAKSGLPTLSLTTLVTQAGGLMSYSVSLKDLYRRAATYVDKILRGAKPANLPVEQPTKLEFTINLKTAKTLGLTIPPSVLMRADEVIQ